jgi:hypothetical protein
MKKFFILWMILWVVGLFLSGFTFSFAQGNPKSLTILYTNNINGEIDPCPS